MASDTEALERTLQSDLDTLGDRLVDEKFCGELYRALANRAWRKSGGPAGHISLSWKRAEELVNALRAARSEPELTLAQTGGEGEVSRTVSDELGGLGWSSVPLNPDRHGAAHVRPARDAPPADTGERLADDPNTRDWERQAHEAAA